MDIPFSDSGLANSEKKWLAGPALIQSHPNPFVPNTNPLVATSPSHCALASSAAAQSKHQLGNTEQDFQCGMSVPNCATSEDLPTSQKAPPRRRCLCKMETAQAGMSCYL